MEPSGAHDPKFRRAFDEHFDAVHRYCLRRLPRDDADDAVVEVFVVAWRKLDRMPGGEGTLPWLYAIARYEVSTSRRSTRRRHSLRDRLSGLAEEADTTGPEVVVVRRSEHQAVVAALESLSPPDREVIRLRCYEDLSTQQIAVVLGCKPEAAKKRLSRALMRLRRAAGIPDPATSSTSRAIQEGGDG